MEKLIYKEVIKSIGNIVIYPMGVEYIDDEYSDYDFKTKELSNRIKSERPYYREAKQNLRYWKKGLRILIKIAKKGPGAMERIANGYHGNGSKSSIDYFWRLYRTISNDDLIEMGKTGKYPCITSYVDGTYTYTL